MHKHSVKVQEYDRADPVVDPEREERKANRCRQVVAFEGHPHDIAEAINEWILDHPGWFIEQLHYAPGSTERYPSALVQMKKAQP